MSYVPKVRGDGLRRYGSYEKTLENTSHCVVEVPVSVGRGYVYHQCTRPRGHGEGGLYCKQHDPEAVKRREKKQDERWEERARAERPGCYATSMYNLLRDRGIMTPEEFEKQAALIVKEIEK